MEQKGKFWMPADQFFPRTIDPPRSIEALVDHVRILYFPP
jgi:hypothetical protein